MKKNILALIAIVGMLAMLLFSCQKQDLHTVRYVIEATDVDLKYRLTENENWIDYVAPIDSTVLFYDNESYTEVFYLYYRYQFQAGVLGTVKIQILFDEVVQDEYIISSDKCAGKTGFLKFKM